MSQVDLLWLAIDAVESAGAEYMLTGSLASSFYGEPRSTHDIGFVVALSPDAVGRLVSAFPADRFYADRETATSAVRAGGMFNVIDEQSGDKIDFWILTNDPFNRSRFARRRSVEYHGRTICMASPEDTILMKLRWNAMIGGSERQLRDARGVYRTCADTLDEPYLSEWADRLGVRDELDRIRRDNPPPAPDHSR